MFFMSIFLLPVIFIKKLRNIGYLNIILMTITMFVLMIVWTLTYKDIKSNKISGTKVDYSYDLNFKTFCLFSSAMMCLFGNSVKMDIYSETESPQYFFYDYFFAMIGYMLFLIIPTGVLGYLAYGTGCNDVILFDLPPENPWSIVCRMLYCCNAYGSYVVVVRGVIYIFESSSLY